MNRGRPDRLMAGWSALASVAFTAVAVSTSAHRVLAVTGAALAGAIALWHAVRARHTTGSPTERARPAEEAS